MRKHVFIDTQLIHPVLIKTLVDLLGADHVMAGSDWPIVDEGPISDVLTGAMREAGLSVDQQNAVASNNCARLLGLNLMVRLSEQKHDTGDKQ
jgi:aminocarboxymuconate-semialdehyde decarboxylase